VNVRGVGVVEDERLEIVLPSELVEDLDEVVGLIGFRSREEFVGVAFRRMLDKFRVLVREGLRRR
jgi:metal-responsive CopG/Arc/MetJ family transcriptional regulator